MLLESLVQYLVEKVAQYSLALQEHFSRDQCVNTQDIFKVIRNRNEAAVNLVQGMEVRVSGR